ncbi:hypothetical protein ACT8ZV_18235 [Nocardioides sp. MAHUQ-72]|uniref:hypothetical protein n=1 Tax=unclassified Nocardioides TaxID=2615069 RepID=UPI0036168BA2
MHSRTTRLLAPSVLALAALGATLPAATADPADRSATTITVRPATLPRGDDPAVPQVLGTTILDGDARIEVPGREVQLFGTSGDDYVVGVWRNDGGSRVLRVAADGSRETVVDRIRGDLVLSADGRRLFEAVQRSGGSVVTVRDASTGDEVGRRPFRGYVRVLDADAGRAVLGGSAPDRTFQWDVAAGTTSRITGREGYFADIRADRVGSFTVARGESTCSVLTTLSAPRTELWRSCRQAVVAASPNGRRLLTQDLVSDGPVGRLSVHRDHGRRLVTYRTPGAFGVSSWETNRSVLITAYGAERAALVRCGVDACERASERIGPNG